MTWVKDEHKRVLVNLNNMDDIFLSLTGKVIANKGETSYRLFTGTPEEAQKFFDKLNIDLQCLGEVVVLT